MVAKYIRLTAPDAEYALYQQKQGAAHRAPGDAEFREGHRGRSFISLLNTS